MYGVGRYILLKLIVCVVGFINSLLSWPAFFPLSRLTYAAYLVHPLVMVWYYLNQRSLVYVSNITMVTPFTSMLRCKLEMCGIDFLFKFGCGLVFKYFNSDSFGMSSFHPVSKKHGLVLDLTLFL